MPTTKLSSKGQIILPKSVRDAHHWRPGSEFAVEEAGDAVILRPANPFKRTTIEEVAGCLPWKGRAKTLKEMDQAIAKAVRERHARGRY